MRYLNRVAFCFVVDVTDLSNMDELLKEANKLKETVDRGFTTINHNVDICEAQMNNIKQALHEVDQIEAGVIKPQTLEQVLAEC